jgi:hypothetical protein
MSFVVNMIPVAFSGETNQDSEPNLAIDPADPRRIAGSAFTPDPLGGATAPIFVSIDGGATWALNNIVPSQAGAATGDITLGFGHDGRLYAGILRRPGGLRLNILRTLDMTGAAAMTVLVDRTGSGVDQPYVEAGRTLAGNGAGNDRVYVGNNDFNAASGRTATVDVSLDGAAATPPPPANFVARRIEPRATSGQDLPPIRPAVHPDGTVYAAYFGRRTGGLSDVVVVRDDDWATGTNPFTALVDATDSLAGQRLVTGITVPFENFQTMGMERLVASDLSIVADPRDSSRVYVAWGDRPGGTTNLTLHIRRSTDRGQTWSGDLHTVANAKAPVVAINSQGNVAFLYQQLTGSAPMQRWLTQVERTSDDFATTTTTQLADVPATAPAPTFLPYLGDYMDMKAVGRDFYGIFSANNTPNNANFPSGVIYQRNANFSTQTLFANDGITPVPVSIDPFFFRLVELASESDFYVADWTDSATVFDLGVEPSVRPVFYATSDVWNRRSNAPGGFDANNHPINETPRNGPGQFGDNFAFARIRRRGTGTAETVTAHFLISEFGTGSNYQNAGSSPDITVNFASADKVLTMAAGYPWHLDPTSSSHFCLAVEISTLQDPVIAPSLLGRAPGWPATDLLVINDNNKAQRNMGIGPTTPGGFLTRYVLIHNAATIRRDLLLGYEYLDAKPVRGDAVFVVGSRPVTPRPVGDVVLEGMEPGENRWIAIKLQGHADRGDATVIFSERVGNVPVNGFGIRAEVRPRHVVTRHILDRTASVFTRLASEGGGRSARTLARQARTLLRSDPDDAALLTFVEPVLPLLTELMTRLLGEQRSNDTFRVAQSQRALQRAIRARDIDAAQSRLGAWLEAIDALVTMRQKARGDLADVCQNLRWQADLFGSGTLANLKRSDRVVRVSLAFVKDFAARRIDVTAYPRLVRTTLPVLRAAAKAVTSEVALQRVRQLADSLDDPLTVQLHHHEYLIALSDSIEH